MYAEDDNLNIISMNITEINFHFGASLESKCHFQRKKVCFLPQKRNLYRTSADILRQYMLVRNWILELRSNKNKTEKQTKCGTRFENSLLEYHAVHKKNL